MNVGTSAAFYCGSRPVAHLEVTEFKSVDEDEIFVLFGMKVVLQNVSCVLIRHRKHICYLVGYTYVANQHIYQYIVYKYRYCYCNIFQYYLFYVG